MKTQQVIDYYGTQYAIAEALGLKQPSVARWARNGTVPHLRQLQIESLTGGALKAEKHILPTSEKKYRKPA